MARPLLEDQRLRVAEGFAQAGTHSEALGIIESLQGLQRSYALAELDLDLLAAYFEGVSAEIAAMPATTAVSEQWGELKLQVTAGTNVAEISALDLDAAWGITLDGPADAVVYINVPNETVELDALLWVYQGGVTSDTTLLNLHQASSIDLSQGDHHVNILAPDASVSFPSGLATGNLVARCLSGGGQVNAGGFGAWVSMP